MRSSSNVKFQLDLEDSYSRSEVENLGTGLDHQ